MDRMRSPLREQAVGSAEGAINSANGLAPGAIHVVLNKILASKTFASSPRYRDFLQFTVTETLAGRGNSLKEYVLGVEVFNQQQSFDPRISPLVRVAASRFRAKLKMYYDTEGCQDRILIDYPKGGYVPVFRGREQVVRKEAERLTFWPRRKGILIIVGLVVLLSALALLSASWGNRRNRQQVRLSQIKIYKGTASIAVLPFLNSSTLQETEDFSSWLAQELVNGTNNVGALRSVPAEASPPLESVISDLAGFGSRLGVDDVLQGSIRTAAGRVQISVQLVAVKSGYHIWSDVYDCRPEDVIVTQHVMARAVVNALRIDPKSIPKKPEAVSLASYNLYLDGLHQISQGSDQKLSLARECFERAIAADPAFGLAYSGLVAAYTQLITWDFVPPYDNLVQAQAMSERALEFRGHPPEAYGLLAVVNSLRWRWNAAAEAFAIAIKGDPSSHEIREAYAVAYLLPMGRLDEALREIQKAKVLDPQSRSTGVSEALIRYCQRDYQGAIDAYQKALTVQPILSGAHFGLASALSQQSRFEEAHAHLKLLPDDRLALALSGYVSGSSGAVREARGALEQLDRISLHQPVPSYYRSLIYLGMGNTSQTVRLLERAYDEREPSLIYLAVSPKWDPLRSHPRFIALLRKIGLAQ